MDLTDIHRTFPSNTEEYAFFSVPYVTFSKIDLLLRHKASLIRYEKIEITALYPIRPPWIKAGHQNNKKNRKLTNY